MSASGPVVEWQFDLAFWPRRLAVGSLVHFVLAADVRSGLSVCGPYEQAQSVIEAQCRLLAAGLLPVAVDVIVGDRNEAPAGVLGMEQYLSDTREQLLQGRERQLVVPDLVLPEGRLPVLCGVLDSVCAVARLVQGDREVRETCQWWTAVGYLATLALVDVVGERVGSRTE